jgi:hypothetical protein
VRPELKLPISPLVGEMPGKAEGGAVPPTFQPLKLPDFLASPSALPPSVLPDISPAKGEIGSFEVD